MDGSEPGGVLAAAVLSGAPTDLQARTVRYDSFGAKTNTIGRLTMFIQNLSSFETGYAIWDLAEPSLAHGLGYFIERPPLGEPVDGVAIICRLHARHASQLQVKGSGNPFRRKARVRILCPGTE